jgi:hypothetical protein
MLNLRNWTHQKNEFHCVKKTHVRSQMCEIWSPRGSHAASVSSKGWQRFSLGWGSKVKLKRWYSFLVGGWATPLKNMSSSAGMIIPNIWKMFQNVPNYQPVLICFDLWTLDEKIGGCMDGWMHGLQGCTWMYMDACGIMRLYTLAFGFMGVCTDMDVKGCI